MSTPEIVKQLVKEISVLSSSLLDAVPRGSKDDKICRRFDALFWEDCWDPGGRLHYICQGKLGMGLVISYLLKIHWTHNFPLDPVELKLRRLIDELRHLHNTEDKIVDQPLPSKKKNATATMSQGKSKRATSATVETVDDVDMTDAEENIYFKGKKKSATLGNPQVVDADSLLIDVDVQLVDNNPTMCEDK
ncbi:hypothetical protein F5148DRAFT_1150796 [Russula earlei]|uniref:Uncharacterized protein n=1 Tax=Russula earlei TaxID=71964 RepID=A0ACC0U2R4_9AGAM|nr:hypothetical protein F5148DRAFT_1150796 [Russula earlei]